MGLRHKQVIISLTGKTVSQLRVLVKILLLDLRAKTQLELEKNAQASLQLFWLVKGVIVKKFKLAFILSIAALISAFNSSWVIYLCGVVVTLFVAFPARAYYNPLKVMLP